MILNSLQPAKPWLETVSGREPVLAAETRRFVVLNADDVGICRGVNRAVVEAHLHGILTSASVMANGIALEHALEHVVANCPQLGVGVHLCLTAGTSVAAAADLPDLVDRSGRFRHSFTSLLWSLRGRPPTLVRQIEIELNAQVEKLVRLGVKLDHVDGHRYVHMLPGVFEVVVKLARMHGRMWVRRPLERTGSVRCWRLPGRCWSRFKNWPKQLLLGMLCRHHHWPSDLPSADHFHGVLDSGAMTGPVLEHLLAHAAPGVTEIVVHPGLPPERDEAIPSAADTAFLSSPLRRVELDALCQLRWLHEFPGCHPCLATFNSLTDATRGNPQTAATLTTKDSR